MNLPSGKKNYATPASKLVKSSSKFIPELLLFVGRPAFLFLSHSFILFLLVLHITGHLIRHSFSFLSGSNLVLMYRYIKTLSSKVSFSLRLVKKEKSFKTGIIYQASKNWVDYLKNYSIKTIAGRSRSLNKKAVLFIQAIKEVKNKTYALKTKSKLLVNKIRLHIAIAESIFSKIKPPKIFRLKTLSFFFLTLTFSGTISVFLFWQIILKDLPSPKELTTRNPEASTKIYDRNGILLYTIYKDKNRTLIPLEKIPIQARLATLAIEDAKFYSHPGFSIKGIIRALVRNIKKGELTGGSTITQQLVKNALLSSEKTVLRKIKEISLAVEVELSFTKDEILEMYLNEVSYGGTAYGIQEASRLYFAKDAKNLNLAEAALLAGLPKSPTKFSPFGTNPDSSIIRQKEVLGLMESNGFITPKQKEEAENEIITFAKNKIDILAPHFVMFVREILEERYGKEIVEKGGLNVSTTLDYNIQKLAEEVVREEVERLSKLNVTNGAVLVLRPQTGEILAMVGSKDYFDLKAQGNVNVVIMPRQPGSSIKIVNYAYALSNGFTAATIVNDSPITLLSDNQPPYIPRNYEGGYRGKLTLRNALAESRNIPAVRVMASYGVEKMIEQGRKMGITTWQDPRDYGFSLTLGGGEVKLLDLARVYATVANYGKRPDIISILRVENQKGKVLQEFDCLKEEKQPLLASASATESARKTKDLPDTCQGMRVLDPKVAFILTDILSDNKARAPSFGANSLLVIPGHPQVAVKTGTSNNLRDNLAIGYNQNYLVSVWVGNNDNSEMARIASGVTGATPIFHKIMSNLLASEPNHNWRVPEGLVQLPICQFTGSLACEGCPVRMEWFLSENKPEKTCNPEWFKKEEEKEKETDKEQVENNGGADDTGQILPEAAKIEVVDKRKKRGILR